jgi:hypothetical protein
MRFTKFCLKLRATNLAVCFGIACLFTGCSLSPIDYSTLNDPNSQRACTEKSLSLLRHNLRFDNTHGSYHEVSRIGNEIQLFESEMHCHSMPPLYDQADYPNPELE